MLDRLKHKLFPCERVMKRLMESHAESVRKNQEAHDRLVTACQADPKKKGCDRLQNIAIFSR